MSNRYKRAGGAWAMLLALLVWWHTSPAEALEGWATNGLSETSAPVVITQLNRAAATAPQVYIVSPRPEEVIADTNVAVQLQVAGTPIFKNSQLGLGPHLHLLLDRVPTESIYDLNTPIILSNLTPGTHTLQVLANKPWHESWKNPQAFAQVTFHVLAKSTNQLNTSSPNAQTPQLISVQPTAVGAEPWLLDFYVANAPSHIDAQHPLRQIADWRVRATVNEESFEVNRDEPLYLRGLRLGVNVLKLEYLNDQGQVVDSTLRVVKYQPNGNDGLSRLVRNELSIDQALTLFDPQSQYSVVGVTGNELGQSDRSPQVPTERSSTAIPSMQQGNQGMQSNPVIQNNPGMQNNPRMYGNSGTQSNPVMQGNSGSQSNPAGIYGNSGTQNNPGIYGNSINPVSPRSTLPVPSRTFSNSAEISQPKRTQQPIAEGTIKTIEGTIKTTEDTTEAIASLPPINQQRTEITANPQHQFPNFSSKDIALLPPVQPQPTSPNSRTAEPKEPIVAIAPPVTKQSQKTTADPTPKILPTNPPAPKSPTVPSPSNNPIAAGEAPLAPKAIVPTDPKSSPPATNEKVVDFKVIGQEIWHTTSVKIKKFTNQIPPLANSWGEKFRHWLGDRIAAMRADSSPTTPSKT